MMYCNVGGVVWQAKCGEASFVAKLGHVNLLDFITVMHPR
jgi:hypothetical protein